MNFFKTDAFKIGIVVIVCMFTIFFMIDFFVLEAFSLTAKLQDRNNALNQKITQVLLKHKKVKTIIRQELVFERIKTVESYIKNNTFNIQPKEIKLIAANIVKYSETNQLPIATTAALIETLSNFNPTLISKNGKRGLFQLDIFTIADKDTKINYKRKLHEIEYNIKTGMSLLKKSIDNVDGDIPIGIINFTRAKVQDDAIRQVFENTLNYITYTNKKVHEYEKNIKAPEIIAQATKQLLIEAEAIK